MLALGLSNASPRSFVTAKRANGANNREPVLFRSYKNPREKSEFPEIKIWQAARATSAAPTYFKSITDDNNTFMDGGLQANNPVGWLVPQITVNASYVLFILTEF